MKRMGKTFLNNMVCKLSFHELHQVAFTSDRGLANLKIVLFSAKGTQGGSN